MIASSKRFLRKCRLGWRSKKCAILFCFITIYMAILRLSNSSGFLTGIYLQMGSTGVVKMFTYQNSTITVNVTMPYSKTEFHNISDMSSGVLTNSFRNITLKPRTASFFTSGNRSNAVAIDTKYLIENQGLCRDVENLSVVIMFHTAPKNFENRMAIRKTWGNNSYYFELGTVKMLYLMGQVDNRSLQKEIEREFTQFGDIVQGDFVDSYHNLTLKGVMGYKWLSERCRNAKIILKVDDDVIVNMFAFLKMFSSKFLSKPRHIACRRLPKAKIQRKKGSKWAVDREMFKGNTIYPPFCQGFMVAISNDIVPDLFSSASVTPFFWIDDIFLYGLVPDNVPRMQYTNLVYGKSLIWGANKGIDCFKRNSCPYLAVLLWSDIPQKMEEIWSLMKRSFGPR